MPDVIALLSFTIAIGGVGIAIVIYHNQSKQGTRIEELTTDIHSYVKHQKQKEGRLQTDYARSILQLINFARMPIHGINVQIKFLKLLYLQYRKKILWKKEHREEEEDRRKQVEMYRKELKDFMIKSSITPGMILELFGERSQLLYEKMWKMFVFTDALSTLNEDFYESLMKNFINTGVEASEELHKIMLELIPDSQKIGYRLHSVDVS